MDAKGLNFEPANASALAFVLYAATLILAREASIGVTESHADVTDLFQKIFDRAD